MEKSQPPPYDSGFSSHPQQPPYNPIITNSPPVFSPPVFSLPVQYQPQSSITVLVGCEAVEVLPLLRGLCPICHNNSWTGTYGCCAWLWCILCFPVGIICCCCMREKKCTKCGFTIG